MEKGESTVSGRVKLSERRVTEEAVLVDFRIKEKKKRERIRKREARLFAF